MVVINMDAYLLLLEILFFISFFYSIFSIPDTKMNYIKKAVNMRHIIEKSKYDNLVVIENNLGNIKATSDVNCAYRCLIVDGCMSMFYHSKTKQCVLHNFLGPYMELHQANGTISNSWKYFEVLVNYEDCSDIRQSNINPPSGVYYISPEQSQTILVYCDMTTDGGGWTVIQRNCGNLDFQRNWTEYEAGFGNSSGDLWLGNKIMHLMTEKNAYELRIDLVDNQNYLRYAVYKTFRIGDSFSKYMLTIRNYSGNAGDIMAHHNTMKFSTIDEDNDLEIHSCVNTHTRGPFWHNDCGGFALNIDFKRTKIYIHSFSYVTKSVMLIRKL